MEVKVPSKAQTGPVEVLIGKKKVPAGTFTVVYPKILSIHPPSIEPGHTIEIVGEHFGITAGPRDPNTMFGVNDVVVGNLVVRPRRWKDDKIEVDVPANAASGDIAVRLASSDPLPDGSCCAPVQHTVSNAVSLKLIPTVQVDPLHGPVGTKVVLFGQGFGQEKTREDRILIGGKEAPVAQWSDRAIVVHVPLNAESGPMVLAQRGQERTVGAFTVEDSESDRCDSCQCSDRHADQNSWRALWRIFRERCDPVQLYGLQYRPESGGNRWSSGGDLPLA